MNLLILLEDHLMELLMLLKMQLMPPDFAANSFDGATNATQNEIDAFSDLVANLFD
jgi:hypothetical protein